MPRDGARLALEPACAILEHLDPFFGRLHCGDSARCVFDERFALTSARVDALGRLVASLVGFTPLCTFELYERLVVRRQSGTISASLASGPVPVDVGLWLLVAFRLLGLGAGVRDHLHFLAVRVLFVT